MRHASTKCWFVLWMLFSLTSSNASAEDKADLRQLTEDLNAVAGVVSEEYSDHVVYFLAYGSSGISGNAIVPTMIARNELNRISRQGKTMLPLARLMQRMILRSDSAQDARGYAFATLQRLAKRSPEAEPLLLAAAKELAAREEDELKEKAMEVLKAAKGPAARKT